MFGFDKVSEILESGERLTDIIRLLRPIRDDHEFLKNSDIRGFGFNKENHYVQSTIISYK